MNIYFWQNNWEKCMRLKHKHAEFDGKIETAFECLRSLEKDYGLTIDRDNYILFCITPGKELNALRNMLEHKVDSDVTVEHVRKLLLKYQPTHEHLQVVFERFWEFQHPPTDGDDTYYFFVLRGKTPVETTTVAA